LLTVVVAALAVIVAWSSPAIAAVDTVSDVPDHSVTFNAQVFTVAYGGNTIYVGGDFTTAFVDGHSFARNGLAAIDATTGSLLSWNPSADAQVRTIAVDGNDVYVGGSFSNLGGVNRDGLALIDGTTGSVSGSFVHTMTGSPRTIAIGNGRVYVGGLFSAIDGASRNNLVAFTEATGAVDQGFVAQTNDRVNALFYTATRLYVGGIFTQLNGTTGTPRLRAVNPTTGVYDSTWRPPAAYEVSAVAQGSAGVYAAAAGPGGRVYAFNSTTGANQWTITTDGDVQAVNVLGDTVYVGGHFDNVCKSASTGTQGTCLDGNTPRGKIFAVDAAGTLLDWSANCQGINGTHQIAVSDALHQVAIGGQWSYVHGIYQRMFAKFSAP
jgi:hypothetical protein